jgi:hypothetical protein
MPKADIEIASRLASRRRMPQPRIRLYRRPKFNSLLDSSEGSIGSSAMPQIGQWPGASRTRSGYMGQVYWTFSGSFFFRPAALPEA